MTKPIYIILAFFHAVLGISLAQPNIGLLKDIVPGTGDGLQNLFSGTASAGGRAVFAAGASTLPSLWITDCTTAGTQIVDEDKLGSPDLFTPTADGTIYFRGDENSVSPALFKIDKDKTVSELILSFSSSTILGIEPFGNSSVLVSARSSGSPEPDELWISDGSASGTFKLQDVATKPDNWRASSFQGRTVLHEKYFNFAPKFKPIITDGTVAGTVFVKDWIAPVSAFSEVMTAIGVGDWVLISGIAGGQPKARLTDGTANGTFSLALPSAAGDFALGALRDGNNLYMWGETNLNVVDLTTKAVTKLSDKVSYYGNPIVANSKLYFYATNGTKVELWETGGTVASTQKMVGSPVIGTDYNDLKLLAVDTSLYYTVKAANTIDLWHYGFASGQHKKVCDLVSLSGGVSVPLIGTVGGQLLFSRSTNDYGYEPWISPSGVSALIEPLGEREELLFSPNPTTGSVSVKIVEANVVSLDVFDVLGKKILTKNIVAGATPVDLDLSGLHAGQYWVISHDVDGRTRTGKIVKI